MDKPESPSQSGCPRCGQVDQAIKISHIVSSGTMTGQSRGTSAGLAIGHGGISPVMLGHSGTFAGRTDLARKFERPTFNRPEVFDNILVPLIVAVLAALGVVLVVVVLGSAADASNDSLMRVAWILGLIVGVYVAIRATRMMVRDRRTFDAEAPARRTINEMWEQFQYCARDDLAFIAGTDHAVRSDDFLKYLLTSARLKVSLDNMVLNDNKGNPQPISGKELKRILGA